MPAQQIRLDAEDAIDGRQLRAVAFQRVRMEYVRRTLDLPALARHGLISGDVCSFEPGSGRDLISAVLARRRGKITDDGIASAVEFRLAPGHHPVVTYFGFARKPSS